MHQIVCRLGLHPRPHWRSLHLSPDSLAVFRGASSKGRRERREGKREEGERRVGSEEKERGGEGVRPLPYRKKKEKLAPMDWPIHN